MHETYLLYESVLDRCSSSWGLTLSSIASSSRRLEPLLRNDEIKRLNTEGVDWKIEQIDFIVALDGCDIFSVLCFAIKLLLIRWAALAISDI